MTLEGTVINGQIVFNPLEPLPEGAKVWLWIQESLPAPPISRDDWVRRLRAIATDCGVSLSNEALSSEGLYD